MAKCHCSLCYDHFDPEQMIIYPCGHGWCSQCNSNYFGQKTYVPCAMCKRRLTRKDGHVLHLEIHDSGYAESKYISTTIEGLEKMDADVKLVSVERGVQRMRKAVGFLRSSAGHDMADTLQRAVEDFTNRILPKLSTMDAQAKQLETLKENLKQTEQDSLTISQQSKKKSEEIRKLQSTLDSLQSDHENAVSFAESVKRELLSLRGKDTAASEDMEKLREENRQCKSLLDEHARKNRKYKEKIKALQQEATSLRAQNNKLEQEMDESLVVKDESENEPLYASSSFSLPESTPTHTQLPSSLSSIINEPLMISGMPRQGFHSDFKLALGKRKPDERHNLPLYLDRNGRPTKPVDCGPKRLRRVP
ncbi:hypothetical protein D9758_008037 [Tetrapyrgos nigripes]|uniref:RING-type domain-containing protein n=1 Tax=Tetrapyrgos nigripes TaxID=182062 RepID=A0A8H5D280_9AGAR|nr:hypothetical protein D9758_008037 [Tetrapyrgos nigripes]